ncbi:MAG: iron-sulfur cluster assembly scaffold protein [Candidatus Heimdallarchaeota archaeon]|nr:MAG: iron-sulfur cluster assembly scaffold protein [Candidatus Heimdallarchaeota archaeon]
MYSEKVMELFKNPKNMGKIEDPDGVVKVENLFCGDVIELYIKVEKDIIIDIKFRTFGCAAAIATSSMITEMVIGKTLDEAMKITCKNVVNELGDLPPIKIYCSNLVAEALHAVIKDCWKRRVKLT